jgi:hypothetical protein
MTINLNSENKLRCLIYAGIVFTIIATCIFYVIIDYCNRDKTIYADFYVTNEIDKQILWPSDLVPHIREFEEKDPFEPKREKGESAEDFERRKEIHDEIRNLV